MNLGQFGFVHVFANPYGLYWPGGAVEALLTFAACMGNWKVEEADVSVP